eukprot:660562-Rhodomonas_salina.1
MESRSTRKRVARNCKGGDRGPEGADTEEGRRLLMTLTLWWIGAVRSHRQGERFSPHHQAEGTRAHCPKAAAYFTVCVTALNEQRFGL